MPKIVDHDERRAQVLAATWRVISRHGIANTTVREIAAEAGCSTGVLAHYFADKDDVLLSALRLATERTAGRMANRLLDKRGMPALRAVLLEALPLDEERRLEWSVWMAFWSRGVGNDDFAQEQRSRYSEWQGLVQHLLAQAADDGETTPGLDSKREAVTLMAIVDGLGIRATFDTAKFGPRALTAAVDAALAGLRRKADAVRLLGA